MKIKIYYSLNGNGWVKIATQCPENGNYFNIYDITFEEGSLYKLKSKRLLRKYIPKYYSDANFELNIIEGNTLVFTSVYNYKEEYKFLVTCCHEIDILF